MKLNRQQLEHAAKQGIIQPQQVTPLWEYLQQHQSGPRFDLTHILYYFGGMLAIGAMSLFMTLGWESFGGIGIFAFALLYAAIGLFLSQHFRRRRLTIPAGIMTTFVVALTPLAVYGLQQSLGFWPDHHTYREYHRYINLNWLYMELATLAVGAIVVWRFRYPFLLMPVAVTLWYLSMDLSELFAAEFLRWQLRALLSMYFGLLMLVIAF